jgi:hypothetical protein
MPLRYKETEGVSLTQIGERIPPTIPLEPNPAELDKYL